MFAEIDWEVLVPNTIAALGVPVLAYMLARMQRKVTSIDRAVNGQPPGSPPMVDRIKGMEVEQVRAAAALIVDDLARKERVDAIAHDLELSHQRAEAVVSVEPGEAADAAAQRDRPTDPQQKET